VGNRLAILASDFDPRSYGQKKLFDLVIKSGGFETRRTNETGPIDIRVKSTPIRKKEPGKGPKKTS